MALNATIRTISAKHEQTVVPIQLPPSMSKRVETMLFFEQNVYEDESDNSRVVSMAPLDTFEKEGAPTRFETARDAPSGKGSYREYPAKKNADRLCVSSCSGE